MKKALALLLSIVLVISSVTCALVFPTSAEGENLWTSVSKDDVGSYSGYGSFKAYVAATQALTIQTTFWQKCYVKLPALEAGKSYCLSLARSYGTATQGGAEATISKGVEMLLISATSHANGTYPSSADIAVVESRNKSVSTDTIHTYFTTGTDTEYYLVFHNDSNYSEVILSGLTLVEVPSNAVTVTGGTANVSGVAATVVGADATVTLNAEVPTGSIFEKWLVVSGDVTLADATSATTTFTMPAEAVEIQAVYKENLWSSFSTACYSQSVGDSSLTGPDSSGIYSVSGTMWYRTHKFALPLLENGKLYRLSFDYRIRQGNNGSNAIQSLTLSVPSENGSSIFGETATDYTWQTIEHQFTGISDQIYLTLATNHADIIQLRNISIIEQQANTDAIETAYNSAAALRVAANSSTGKNGLRVYNEIKTEWSDSVNIVEFGSIAVREGLMQTNTTLSGLAEAGKPTLAMKDAGVKGVGVGVAYSEADGISNLWGTTDGTIQFTSYLTGIKPEYYGDDYLIRTYAIDADGTVYYGDAIAVSVFDVANAMDHGQTADGSETTEADEAAFAAFITENKKDEYATWCGTAGVGDLYNKYYGEVTAE